MGHDSTAAAIIYQLASQKADRAIADALSLRLEAVRMPQKAADDDA